MIVFILGDIDQNWQCLGFDNEPKPWGSSLTTPLNGKPAVSTICTSLSRIRRN